jgi:membrane protein implicated in regulation of membrane protease activity
MDSEAPKETPRHGSNVFIIFITSLSAAIVVAGGFGIVFQAAILAAAARLGLGPSFLWVASAINAVLTLWLGLWTFARSWHVERRLKAGLEVDEPKLSILANFRGS